MKLGRTSSLSGDACQALRMTAIGGDLAVLKKKRHKHVTNACDFPISPQKIA